MTITFINNTPVVNHIYVKDCIPGGIYICRAGYDGGIDESANDYVGKLYIASGGVSNQLDTVLMQEIGNSRIILNPYWMMEELQNVTISY
jgi:hypothetical protein